LGQSIRAWNLKGFLSFSLSSVTPQDELLADEESEISVNQDSKYLVKGLT
jgi:hypothetical protein